MYINCFLYFNNCFLYFNKLGERVPQSYPLYILFTMLMKITHTIYRDISSSSLCFLTYDIQTHHSVCALSHWFDNVNKVLEVVSSINNKPLYQMTSHSTVLLVNLEQTFKWSVFYFLFGLTLYSHRCYWFCLRPLYLVCKYKNDGAL